MLAKPRAMPAPPLSHSRRAVVALGANLGDRRATLEQAVALIAAEIGDGRGALRLAGDAGA